MSKSLQNHHDEQNTWGISIIYNLPDHGNLSDCTTSDEFIAPAVISLLQNVADNTASTSTTVEVASQIMKELGLAGFGVSEAEATTMGAILIAMAAAGTAVEIYKLHKLGPWIPKLDVKPPTIPLKPTLFSTSSSATIREVRVIPFFPYSTPS